MGKYEDGVGVEGSHVASGRMSSGVGDGARLVRVVGGPVDVGGAMPCRRCASDVGRRLNRHVHRATRATGHYCSLVSLGQFVRGARLSDHGRRADRIRVHVRLNDT